MKNKVIQRVAMKAVIVKNDKILLLREASAYKDGSNVGKYHFPGGRIEPGESFKVALKREVKEETGLEVELGMPIYVGEWSPVIRGVKNHIVATFLVSKPITTDITLSEEHDSYEWVDEMSWKNLVVMDPDDEVIKRYYELQKLGLL